jgi:hypothetical protein
MKRFFKTISPGQRKRFMRDCYVQYSVRAGELEIQIKRAQATLDRSLRNQRRELAELRARMASLERERDRE